MRGKNKITIIVIALIVVVALGLGGYRFFSPLSLAEGYLYEDENRIVYAKVTQDQDNVNVEVMETKVETEDSIPVLKNSMIQFSGTIEGGKLNLKPQTEGGQEMNATVSADELVFLGPIATPDTNGTKLLASQMAVYQNKLQALTTRVNEEAEVKKKEVAERRAKEAARVEFAKKVERSTKLAADLIESAKYLNEIQFEDETRFNKEQVTELQGLLDEITLYATQPGLKKTEYEVMQGTAGSMKVLLDGMNTMDATIQEKKKRMTDLIAVLEADIADSKAVWEEIKASVPDAQKREEAVNQAIKEATQAVEQAKQRRAAIEKEQASLKQSANKLYQNAVGVVSQTKTKHAF
ncbi:hypothetical protein [Brevibacillus sp. NRS-1366]|uniref:hypothetical protein n=1 Tax=Brevibacillus sp. NRS-1366 TaxID=3233899 RepID=UPI003D239037